MGLERLGHLCCSKSNVMDSKSDRPTPSCPVGGRATTLHITKFGDLTICNRHSPLTCLCRLHRGLSLHDRQFLQRQAHGSSMRRSHLHGAPEQAGSYTWHQLTTRRNSTVLPSRKYERPIRTACQAQESLKVAAGAHRDPGPSAGVRQRRKLQCTATEQQTTVGSISVRVERRCWSQGHDDDNATVRIMQQLPHSPMLVHERFPGNPMSVLESSRCSRNSAGGAMQTEIFTF